MHAHIFNASWSPDAAKQKALAQRYAELTQSAPLAKDLPSVRNWVQSTLANENWDAKVQAQGVEKASEAGPALAAPDVRSAAPAQSAMAKVQRGVLLERQAQPRVEDPQPLLGLALITLLMAGGAMHQSLKGHHIGLRKDV